MKATIREAEIKDVTQILGLIKELAVFEKEPDAVKISEAELTAEGFGKDPLFTCFVAEFNENIVGMALVYFRFSTWNGRNLHLEDLIVTQSMRGKGFGLALYKKVMEFAHENGVKRVDWVVLDWNVPAIKFYEKSGANIHKDWYLVQMDELGLQRFLKKE